MKKALTITAVSVILFTAIFFGYSILFDGSSDPGDMKGLISFLDSLILLVFFLMIASEIALFGGIGLLISENRTPSKIILGIVVIIISLIVLITSISFFFEFNITPAG